MDHAKLVVIRMEEARGSRGISVAELARRASIDRKRLAVVAALAATLAALHEKRRNRADDGTESEEKEESEEEDSKDE